MSNSNSKRVTENSENPAQDVLPEHALDMQEWQKMLPANPARAVFAEVIVDIAVRELADKLFTYRVPESLVKEVFVGSAVLVPFGHQDLVGGYVVSLDDERQVDFRTKEIVDVLDAEPLFDRDYIDFLWWVAYRYAAPVTSVIQAAIPADFGPRLRRVVRLKDSPGDNDLTPVELTIIEQLLESKGKSLSLAALRQRLKTSKLVFYKALTRLRQTNVVSVEQEASKSMAPKLITNVIWTGAEAQTAKQESIVAELKHAGGQLPLARLLEAAKTTSATVKKMAEQGIVTIGQLEVVRDPLSDFAFPVNDPFLAGFSADADISNSDAISNVLSGETPANALAQTSSGSSAGDTESPTSRAAPGCSRTLPALTQFQEEALSTLISELRLQIGPTKIAEKACANDSPPVVGASQKPEPWLLYGVTGSGKTEVYLRLIQEAISLNRSAMLLVPEISLTPQLAQRLKSRFADKVAIWHSGLSAGERYDTARRLRAGDIKVLLGARSAILAHMPDLGLIILDEEHDSSYKQSSPAPRYHAKELALYRAGYYQDEDIARSRALVVLGSATPDVCSYYSATANNRVLRLPERVFKQEMPRVSLIDMREEYAHGHYGIFSRAMLNAVQDCLAAGEQVILLMNRRGYASYVFCKACGDILKCRNCSVSLVYHQTTKKGTTTAYLACHHCGFQRSALGDCPACEGPFLKQQGMGTQRVEEELQEIFPESRLLRLDSDTTKKRGAHESILRSFASGEADILIGTQMVAKGLDIANVTLVGVLAADAAFNLPDYRSVERGFQLLTQVSGRAGRGKRPGSVILQTYTPDMPALQLAKTHNYQEFVKEELESREQLQYPPFSQLIRVVITGAEEKQVAFAAEELAEDLSSQLDDQISENGVRVLGPSPCLIERLMERYRYQLIIKNLAGDKGLKLLTGYLRGKKLGQGLSLAIDVDAYDFV